LIGGSAVFPLGSGAFAVEFPLASGVFAVEFPLGSGAFAVEFPLASGVFAVEFPLASGAFAVEFPLASVATELSLLSAVAFANLLGENELECRQLGTQFDTPWHYQDQRLLSRPHFFDCFLQL
jgi:hypothetical protein